MYVPAWDTLLRGVRGSISFSGITVNPTDVMRSRTSRYPFRRRNATTRQLEEFPPRAFFWVLSPVF